MREVRRICKRMAAGSGTALERTDRGENEITDVVTQRSVPGCVFFAFGKTETLQPDGTLWSIWSL